MTTTTGKRRRALAAAFPQTIPILTGFLFLGFTYGVYMRAAGFSFYYPMLMSLTIFAGSMEFLTVNLLLSPFQPLQVLLLTLMVNARHLFYGLAMLERYQGAGLKKLYLIFGMCDETFSVNCTAAPPEDVDRGWFYFFVTLLDHCYWVLGATLGGLFGGVLPISTEGLDFVMTAMFVVIFLEQWRKDASHSSAILGAVLSVACLLLFGADGFMLPAMLAILGSLILLRQWKKNEAAK